MAIREKMAKKLFGVAASGVLAAVLLVAGSNAAMVLGTRGDLHEPDELVDYEADAIVVLGAMVHPDGTPSDVLRDRLDCGADLYEAGVAPLIIASGDNGAIEYNEVDAMKRYLVEERGIPSEDVFCDHAGIATYESMYRARYLFGCERIVVATQTYHQYRALHMAHVLGMEAVGVPSEARMYGGQLWFSTREVLARTKDFFKVIAAPEPEIMGETISLDQSGDVTNGKYA